MLNRLNAVKDTRSELQKQLSELRTSIDKEKSSREETVSGVRSDVVCCNGVLIIIHDKKDDRADALAELTSVRAELVGLEKEMSQYGSCDPVKLEAKRRAATLGQEAAARWTGEEQH